MSMAGALRLQQNPVLGGTIRSEFLLLSSIICCQIEIWLNKKRIQLSTEVKSSEDVIYRFKNNFIKITWARHRATEKTGSWSLPLMFLVS